jgi:nucleotide-binding universal stress UspA family protein
VQIPRFPERHSRFVEEDVMVRIKKILCPIDFSDFSRHAFDRAAAIAKGTGASVTAIHVRPLETTPVYPTIEPQGVEALMLTEADRATLTLDLRRFLAIEDPIGVPVSCDVVDAPNVHHEILAQADRLPADLIVMGTHGRSGFQRLLLGSVTEKVLRTARAPLLTVGAVPDVLPAGDFSFKRILCAIDFSECSIAALRYAASLAEPAEAELTALYVIEWTPIGYDPLFGPPTDLAGYRMAAEADGRERLHNTVAEFPHKTVVEIVSSGKPHHEILRIAAERQSDLIVLGIHGRHPLDRMLFGSTAEPVVRRSPCPVLTVRKEGQAASAAA